MGTQAATGSHVFTTPDGTSHDNEKGTWSGVDNNYGNGPVASLGSVRGSYVENTTTSNGLVSGTEEFQSPVGTITQTFNYPTNFSYFNVSVRATGELAFLTSSTAGQCYPGAFPRP